MPWPSPVKMAFKTVIRTIVNGSTKIEFSTFQNNRAFFASASLSVLIKYTIFCKFRLLEYSMYSAIPFRHSVSPPFLPIGSLLLLLFRENNCNFRKCWSYVQSFKYLCRVHIFCRHTKVQLHDTFLKGDYAHLISRPLSLFCLRHIPNFARRFFVPNFSFPGLLSKN